MQKLSTKEHQAGPEPAAAPEKHETLLAAWAAPLRRKVTGVPTSLIERKIDSDAGSEKRLLACGFADAEDNCISGRDV